MAPKCVCGHRASEHQKQMSMRTYCNYEEPGLSMNTREVTPGALCGCLMYRSVEADGNTPAMAIFDETQAEM